MDKLLLFALCMVVVASLFVFFVRACGIDLIKPMPKPLVRPKLTMAERLCRRHQARTRLGELLQCSHPEWN